ncbi:MAG: class I SAM-dependent methyltransferase [Magnetospirillum sp.]|nr:class I SAM-dependent methyltransferase [Magnetospirillum sp.]
MRDTAPGFYGSYASYKKYATPEIGPKHIRRFDTDIWRPGACAADMRFLEIGCGTGAFLAYLAAKGVTDFVGIDHDPALAAVIPETVRDRFACRDVWQALADPDLGELDRVVALDVIEHFAAEDALRLLTAVKGALTPGGRIVLKVPNAACPWGLQYQFGDLTHRTAFTPHSLRQLATAAGLNVVSVLPHRQGSRRRLATDALVHRFLSWALSTPPEIWTANIIAVLEKRD